MVDRISNFGSFPPTARLHERWGVRLVLLNHADPLATRAQMQGIESHDCVAGSWEPVPLDLGGFDGVAFAKRVHDRVFELGSRVVGLNLEALTITQIRDFLWGRPGARGWRGVGGVVGSTGGWNGGIPCFWIDEPFKDGTVKPHSDLKTARMMLAVEGFDGIMRQIDHPRAILDRVLGFRNGSGINVPSDAYPAEQVTGCYDAALGIRIRQGLYFTAEQLPGIFTVRQRLRKRLSRR